MDKMDDDYLLNCSLRELSELVDELLENKDFDTLGILVSKLDTAAAHIARKAAYAGTMEILCNKVDAMKRQNQVAKSLRRMLGYNATPNISF